MLYQRLRHITHKCWVTGVSGFPWECLYTLGHYSLTESFPISFIPVELISKSTELKNKTIYKSVWQ